ncbi:MAG: excinuclease ABC subunit UvrA [Opitutae bacterium]|nr:excinuclease ABC subunit UvrA [Opitutae bacterium]MDG1300793.1 excinuclease ABC subunit UvrA [Opitutae bacterium]
MPSTETIHLRGIRQNNLTGFDLDLPIGQLTVVTGLSGAGKSSLVFETLHAEGQRRYVETFSPYTRQFMELMDRPKVDSIENIRPSIAIQQSNTVKTSRSTVGTITELCDFFKVWFPNVATLIDPATGEPITDDNPQSIWKKLLKAHKDQTVLIAFPITRPEKFDWSEILQPLSAQGYTRVIHNRSVTRISDLQSESSALKTQTTSLVVIQDRIKVGTKTRTRFIEAAQTGLTFGKGQIQILNTDGVTLAEFTHGLHSPETGITYRPATAPLFSFNSPIGACEKCKGFGRIIEIDYNLVTPDKSLSIDDGAIRAFQGAVYSESLRDLQRAAKKHKIRTDLPWSKLNKQEILFILEGEPNYKENHNQWYGIYRFFDWLQSKIYKMHVRVFLSKFRSYSRCPDCDGSRLKPEALNWKWKNHTLPDLYQKSVGELLTLMEGNSQSLLEKNDGTSSASSAEPINPADHADHAEVIPPSADHDSALSEIISRLSFLDQVGLGYLTLDRTSRTLSGGETMRVNLTSCLGSSLVDALFVLDEPSVGLHARDMDRLISILRRLTDQGNTVVVVEHDEVVMRAADNLIEIGPKPGIHGGQLIFNGDYNRILLSDTITGRFLSGRETIDPPTKLRNTKKGPKLSVYGASKHNLKGIDLHIPQQAFVCLSGVSGSGKSTLLNNVIYQNLLAQKGLITDDPATIKDIDYTLPLSDVVLIDQSPVSKTPRSNPASYSDAWSEIRKLFAKLESAQSAGMMPGHFSFNSGEGRCESCSGLGYERIEMQFVSDLFVPCQSCEGQRFKPEVLEIQFNALSITEILEMDVDDAVVFFEDYPKITTCLTPMIDVGLGYLKLGQPLNTLSGGESQRLKLIRYLGKIAGKSGHALILIDEPSTGLHRADVKRLIDVLQGLVNAGHSLIVIEHNIDILKIADWIVEIGPEAGIGGGQIIAQGKPCDIAKTKCETAAYLRDALAVADSVPSAKLKTTEPKSTDISHPHSLTVRGAREHNLKNISCEIPHNKISVITGVSGSGKSSLAFDIIFAEGQRRFMESMSAYARQFVEQMPRADVDELHGIAPTVAIEQRVTKGTRKSTVATITEVAQHLRLLYARIGIQHSPSSGEAVISQTEGALLRRLKTILTEPKAKQLHLCAQLVRGRKGHHQPLADWASDHGYETLRIDGQIVPISQFQKLDRYSEHDIELVIATLSAGMASVSSTLKEALKIGKGTAFLLNSQNEIVSWLSTKRTDPISGEAFPELDPKNFSWNSVRGWCSSCRGYGQIFDWMSKDEAAAIDVPDGVEDGDTCPDCKGARLNLLSRAVKLPLKTSNNKQAKTNNAVSLPELLALTPNELINTLKRVKTDKRSGPVLQELLPEIEERLRFMDRVGLNYLGLDRATATLSGGEAQRIRLAAQLGSNLSGVLYVLDEPSIGLHARDNAQLITALEQLRDRGNTLLIVEHDEDTMKHADQIIDIGPAAGIHGGEIVASGTLAQLKKNKQSITGKYLRKSMPHPLRGAYPELPAPWSPRKKKGNEHWISLQGAALRNLKGFDVQIPKQRLTVICGVSGAGKSTLCRDLLKPLVEVAIEMKSDKLTAKELRARHGTPLQPSNLGASLGTPANHFKALHHAENVRKVIEVDQSPIGKTPRSTPATYIGAFDIIRDIYASLPEARARGYSAGTFSFNTKGGRCETCKGAGRLKLEMNFMPDTYVTCEDCNGRRYGAELDELRWNGKNIADALLMSFEEAAGFFSFHTGLHGLLQAMVETGLGYIKLGQYSPTLSGGEAQRLKLVSELAKGMPTFKERQYNKGQGNLYILEEPTIGLHLADVERLIELLHRLVDKGHTVVVIEHHLDVIADADYLVEIGPNGGEAGGKLLYQGAVQGIKKIKASVTAAFLKD